MKKLIHFLTAFFLTALMVAGTMNATAQTPFVRVLQPNHANIQWAQKTTHLISWKDNFSHTVNIDLIRYYNGTQHIYHLAHNISGSTHSWFIDKDMNGNSISVGTQYYYKIQVSSSVDPSFSDLSNSYFKITASAAHTKVRVLQPNHSNIQWAQKTTHLISWKDNIPGTVNIDLIRYYNGAQHIYHLAQNISGSTHSWYIDKDMNGNSISVGTSYYYKIQVSSSADPSVADLSDNYFKITASAAHTKVRVLQPNHANIQWAHKTTHLISWIDNIPGTVNIDLIRYYNGAQHIYHLAQNISGSTHSWYIDKDMNGNSISVGTQYYYKIQVSSSADPSVTDLSNSYFKITASAAHTWVRVLQPNHANIQWAHKTTHLISWKDNIPGTVNIDLIRYYNGTQHIYHLAQNISGSTHSWYIDKDMNGNSISVGTSYYYKIKVSSSVDPSVADLSNSYFKITASAAHTKVRVLQPNHSNIQWAQKTTHLISWIDNIPGTVNIDLIRYYNGAQHIYHLAQNISGSTHSWYIDKDMNGNSISVGTQYYYKIQVSSSADPSVADLSNSYFKITASAAHTRIRVIQPNHANIKWKQKETYLVSWIDNIPGTVNIDLIRYYNGAQHIYHLAQNISGSTYSWYIDKDMNGNSISVGTQYYYKIQISSSVDPSVADLSDNYFKIILAPTIDVYPNPSTTSVTVQFNQNSNEQYILTLYNRYNMRILRKPVNTSATKQVRINTFNLPNGIYFLRLVSGKEVISRKIVVQH